MIAVPTVRTHVSQTYPRHAPRPRTDPGESPTTPSYSAHASGGADRDVGGFGVPPVVPSSPSTDATQWSSVITGDPAGVVGHDRTAA